MKTQTDILENIKKLEIELAFLFMQRKPNYDESGKMWVDFKGVVYWSFGSYKDKPIIDNLKYCKWVLNNSFPEDTKQAIKKVLFKNKIVKRKFDDACKLSIDYDGVVYWNFGSRKDAPIINDINYCMWVLKNDFPEETKNKIRSVIWKRKNKKYYYN